MDFFTKELGPAYVPALAARLLLAMGCGIARGGDDFRRQLDEDVEGLWTLALLTARWHAAVLPPAEAKVVADALPDPEMVSILASLNAFRERLLPFTTAAHQARTDAQLAAAGVYFVAAVEAIGVAMLSAAIKSGPVTALHERLHARLPLPAEVKARYDQTLGASPTGTTPRPSRADRFDLADRVPRPTRTVPPVAGARVVHRTVPSRTVPAGAPPLQPPAPQLEHADVTRAYLHTLGWQVHEVDRLLAGPADKKPA